MQSRNFSKKFMCAVFLTVSIAMLVGLPVDQVEGAEAASAGSRIVSPDGVAFYTKYTGLDKVVYWTGNAVAPQVTKRAQIWHFVPVKAFGSEYQVEMLLERGIAAVCFRPKDEAYYVVMEKETAGRYLGASDLTSLKKRLGEKVEEVGLVMSKSTFSSVGLEAQLRAKNINSLQIISWRPKVVPISEKAASTEPKLNRLIEKGIVHPDPDRYSRMPREKPSISREKKN